MRAAALDLQICKKNRGYLVLCCDVTRKWINSINISYVFAKNE